MAHSSSSITIKWILYVHSHKFTLVAEHEHLFCHYKWCKATNYKHRDSPLKFKLTCYLSRKLFRKSSSLFFIISNIYSKNWQQKNLSRWNSNKKTQKQKITCINLIHCLADRGIRYNVNHQNVLYAISISSHHLIKLMKTNKINNFDYFYPNRTSFIPSFSLLLQKIK